MQKAAGIREKAHGADGTIKITGGVRVWGQSPDKIM
jgi:hypothetical protein